MKITITSDKIYTAVVIFIVGLGIWMALPQFEKSVHYVNLGTISVSAAPNDAFQEFGTPSMINVPLSWSAPFVGNCYLTIDIRPQGAAKGEPETPEWEASHLIRAKFDQRWWIQKWVNVFVLQQREGTTELRFAIADPKTTAVDVYSELMCDDQLLDEDKVTANYQS